MLPDLPKTKQDQEAEFGLLFRKWINAHKDYFDESCSFELKHTRGEDYLPYDELGAAQIAYASKITGEGVLVRVIGSDGQPDYIWMRHAPSHIAIRYPKFWCVLLVGDFVWERNMGKRKSLTSARAREIAIKVVEV